MRRSIRSPDRNVIRFRDTSPVQEDIGSPGTDLDAIIKKLAAKPSQLHEVLAGLQSDKAAVKFGCLKILSMLSEREPAVLYPQFDRFVALTGSENNILKWGGIIILGNLAAVDSENRLDAIWERFLQPISGPAMITAANTIRAGAAAVATKPHLADRFARALLGVEKASYQTPECRNVALGHVLKVLDRIFPHVKERQRLVEFAKRQLNNRRPAVREKARVFLKRHEQRVRSTRQSLAQSVAGARTFAVTLPIIAMLLWAVAPQLHAQPDITLEQALDTTNLVWSTRGHGWHGQIAVSHDHNDAAQAGPLRSGIIAEAAWLETYVQGPGLLSFWWAAAATNDLFRGADFTCAFMAAGVVLRESEETLNGLWKQVLLPISAGPGQLTELRWEFSTLGGCGDPAAGTAWLDNVSFTPVQPQMKWPRVTATNLVLELAAPAGTWFRAEQSTNLLNWEAVPDLGRLECRDGQTRMELPKPEGPRLFYRARWVP